MGFMISLICVYLNTYETFQWNSATLGGIFLIALPNTLWIANLMLANNICDLEEDENNNRYTLVHYLGKESRITAICSFEHYCICSDLDSSGSAFSTMDDVVDVSRLTICLETDKTIYA